MNEEWSSLILRTARSLWRPGYSRWLDIEDLVQAGWLKAEKARRSKGLSFEEMSDGFVAFTARAGMIDHLREVLNRRIGKGKLPSGHPNSQKKSYQGGEFNNREYKDFSYDCPVSMPKGALTLREYTRFLLPEAAMVIRLIYEQDMTYQEVAAAIGKSDSWVHVVHRKSLVALKQILERRVSAAKRKSTT